MRLLTTFKLMRKRLLRIAELRLGSRSAADDALQDVWLKLARIDDDDTIENVCGFVRTVFNNVVTSRLRQELRRAAIDRDVQGVHWPGDDLRTPERILMARDLLASVAEMLDAMPARTRAIFVAHRLDGKPRSQIAREHAISEEAVHYHIKRAARRLARVRDEGEDQDN